MDVAYWNTVYKKHSYEKGEIPTNASSFAQSVVPVIDHLQPLVELGCGNVILFFF